MSKPKSKKSAPRQPQARKQKTDILRFPPKKVYTPGSLPISAVKAKVKAPIAASNAEVAKAGMSASELDPATAAMNAVDNPLASESDNLSTMPPSLKVRAWLEKQKISGKPSQNNPEPMPSSSVEASASSVSKSSPKRSKFTKPVTKNKLAASSLLRKPAASKAASKAAPKKSQVIKPAQKTSLQNTKKTSLANKSSQNKENLPGDQNHVIKSGPSGQFRLGRGSQLLEESGKISKEKPRPFAKKLFTVEYIEKQLDLDKTPTRK